jgi:hypothetical protein
MGHVAFGEHSVIAAGCLMFLARILAHRTNEALAGFEKGENYDLEFAMAAAYRAAPRRSRSAWARCPPEYIPDALAHVVREKQHQRGWIAWQRRFMRATYSEALKTNKDLAEFISKTAQEHGLILERLEAVGVAVGTVDSKVGVIGKWTDARAAGGAQAPASPFWCAEYASARPVRW